MKKNKKQRKILMLLILLMAVTIGYALLSTTLKINGTAGIQKNTWDIHWENVQPNAESTVTTEKPVISDNATKVSYTVDLELPGDFYEFTVDAKNDGSIDGEITKIDHTFYTVNTTTGEETEISSLPSYIISTVYYDGTTTPPALGDILESKKKQTYRVRIEFDPEATILPSTDTTIKIVDEVTYTQTKKQEDFYDGEATPSEAVLGLWFYEINNDGDHTASIVAINKNYDDGVIGQIKTYGDENYGSFYNDNWGGPISPSYLKRVVIPAKVKLNSEGKLAPTTGEEYTITRYYEYYSYEDGGSTSGNRTYPANVTQEKSQYITQNGGISIIEVNNAIQELILPNTIQVLKFNIGGHNKTTNIHLSNNITKIEHFDFDGWNQSLSIRIPKSVTTIESEAFAPYYNRENGFNIIYVPNSVKSIGEDAFGYGTTYTDRNVNEIVVQDQATADLVRASGYARTVTVDPSEF